MNIQCIVNNDLCTGCGVCISEDSSYSAYMDWNKYGFLVPHLSEQSTQKEMYNVCPFNFNQIDEDQLGLDFIKSQTSKFNNKIGYYENLYVGYSKKFRETSSSGGMATYIFEQLLEKKLVSYLFVVQDFENIFKYCLVEKSEDIKKISKTRYMPVTMESLFKIIDDIDGKIAISGVACFVKAIRLKQKNRPDLREKIPYIVGIICGGLKSKYYTDFLAQSAGCTTEYNSIQYRVKNKNSFALDYKFSCKSIDDRRIHMVDMQSLGDMWGTGLFKSNACDFCDDVMTELADISLGDAWIEPYNKSGLGNSIVVVRNLELNSIIKEGIIKQTLLLENLSEEGAIKSQGGSFNHRHEGIFFRINRSIKSKKIYPNKRSRFFKKKNILFNLVQGARLRTRANSLKLWRKHKEINKFNSEIQADLKFLKKVTKLHHKVVKFKSFVKNFFNIGN